MASIALVVDGSPKGKVCKVVAVVKDLGLAKIWASAYNHLGVMDCFVVEMSEEDVDQAVLEIKVVQQ